MPKHPPAGEQTDNPYTDWQTAKAQEEFHLAEAMKWRAKRYEARKKIVGNIMDIQIDRLSSREIQVLELLRRQPFLANKEIAAQLNISVRTVKFHVSNILRKFEVPNRYMLLER